MLAGTAAAAASGGTLTYAALSPASQIFGRTLIAGRDPRELALTFDDGPNPAITPQLLDLLAEHNARATFFMIGKWVRQQPALARRVHAAGHLVGNHTETHPWLPLQPASVIREELLGCNRALEDALGAPVGYFRPPHGARRPLVVRYAAELGLTTVQWNVMAEDWKPTGRDVMLAKLDRGLARARGRGGANILLHDGSDRTPAADRSATLHLTRTLLDRCAQQQLHPVTVDAWV
jgi:peptidoglycan/xylan/chitin deacetylase (PgdA/CDA1 family)